MSRDRAPFQAQGTWRSGKLHVWGWNGESTASSAWLYSGFQRAHYGDKTAWHDSPLSYGAIGRITLELPDGGYQPTAVVSMEPYGAAVWLSEVPDGPALSASLAWFASLARFAVQLVGGNCLTPIVTSDSGLPVTRWQPLLTAAERDQLSYAASVAPPICRNGSVAPTEEILAGFVDGVARQILESSGWRPELGRRRSTTLQATRAIFSAGAKIDPTIRSGSGEYNLEVARIGEVLDRHRRRMNGEAVLRGRLRLHVPDDPLDAWRLGLEIVDDTDPSRWCTAEDIWCHAPRALDLVAPTQPHLLTDELSALVDRLADSVPGLEPLLDSPESTAVEFDLDQVDDFLNDGLPIIESLGVELIGPEQLVSSKVRLRATASTAPPDDRRSRFGKEALVDWSAVIDDTPISTADLSRAAELGRTLMRTGHRWVRIDADGIRRAHKLLSEQVEHRSTAAPVELLQLAAGALGDGVTDVEFDYRSTGLGDDWIDTLLNGLADDRLTEAHESPDFVGELRHYQRRALAWLELLADIGLGGVLADDMGLGKTATALAHIQTRSGPHLVVCPLSVVHNWENEAHRFTPNMSVVVHHGASRHQGEPALFGLDDADLVITTYGLLARDLNTLSGIEWGTVILDEAQNIKNSATKAAKAARALRGGQRIALTGTPVENRLNELWSILDWVNPGLLGSQQQFRDRYAGPIERNAGNSVDAELNSVADIVERLRSLTGPFILRRTKQDRTLLPDLPDKLEQVAYAALTAEQATLYQQVVDQLLVDAKELDGMQRRGRVLSAITRLKQVCNHPAHALKDGSRLHGRSGKLNRFDELVENVLDVDERALVFTQFREMGDLLQQHVTTRFGVTPPFLHGGVSKRRRDAMVAEFQAGDGPPLFIVSLKAGGTGLNLTAANHVIHYDRWWNPAVEDQATDRAWRLGQDRLVNVHKLVCEGTVEERIGDIIDEKRKIADAVVGAGEAWISELDVDELAALVALEVRR